MKEVGIDISHHKPKSVEIYLDEIKEAFYKFYIEEKID